MQSPELQGLQCYISHTSQLYGSESLWKLKKYAIRNTGDNISANST